MKENEDFDFIDLSMKVTNEGLSTEVQVDPMIVKFLENQSGTESKKIVRKIAMVTSQFVSDIEDLIEKLGGTKDGIQIRCIQLKFS